VSALGPWLKGVIEARAEYDLSPCLQAHGLRAVHPEAESYFDSTVNGVRNNAASCIRR
jgi:hypothetical protein